MTEEQLQAACIQWFWNNFPQHRRMLFHTKNNSHNRTAGARNKTLGVVAGVADLILIVCGQVVFIELKVGKGVQSAEQKDFMAKVIERQHVYLVIKDLETFKQIVCSIIGKN